MSEYQESYESFGHNFSEPEEATERDAVMSGKFTGIIEGLSNEDYHKAPGLSFSGLKEFSKTPAHYQAYLRRESEDTPARRLGTGVHMRVLEPNRFLTDVVTVPNRLSKENKERVAQAEAEGKWVLTSKEYDQINRIGDAVLKNTLVQQFLSGGKAEQSVFWTDPSTGILLKCRPDYLRPDGVTVDLKTFDDLDDEAIRRQIYRMKYHWQSAHYLAGVNHALGIENNTMFAHLFIQTDDPYLCRIVLLNDASLEKSEEEIAPFREGFKHCLKTNTWPGYPDDISETSIPDFAW